MKTAFLLVFLTLSTFVFSQNKTKFSTLYDKPIERKYYVTERYHNGKLYVEGQAVQKVYSKKKRVELKRGPWKWYYRNGQLKDSIFYSDLGLPTGIETKYNSDGLVSEKIDYGTSTNFIIRERNWLTTIAKDYSKTYYYDSPNIPQKTTLYLNGKKSGTWLYFDKKGTLISEKKYVNGKLISTNKY